MVLCFSNNIKHGSKYWQELTGQMLGSNGGRNPAFCFPHAVPVVSSVCKVTETIFVWSRVGKGVGVCVCLSLSNHACVCVCVFF